MPMIIVVVAKKKKNKKQQHYSKLNPMNSSLNSYSEEDYTKPHKENNKKKAERISRFFFH